MRHIWICLIDGVIVRSGAVQPQDTMPMLQEKLMRVYPHMQIDSLKVLREDGSVFDVELPFHNPSPNDPNRKDVDDILAAVGVVEGHLGVQIYHGKATEEILATEANNFPEKITEQMDFGVFNFAGDQLVSIEDVINFLGPKNVQEVENKEGPRNNNRNRRGSRQRRPLRRRGSNGRNQGPRDSSSPGAPGQSNTSDAPNQAPQEGNEGSTESNQEGSDQTDGDDFEEQDGISDQEVHSNNAQESERQKPSERTPPDSQENL
jgi:hypothetical protein